MSLQGRKDRLTRGSPASRTSDKVDARARDGSAQASRVVPVDAHVPHSEDDHCAEQDEVDLVDGQKQNSQHRQFRCDSLPGETRTAIVVPACPTRSRARSSEFSFEEAGSASLLWSLAQSTFGTDSNAM